MVSFRIASAFVILLLFLPVAAALCDTTLRVHLEQGPGTIVEGQTLNGRFTLVENISAVMSASFVDTPLDSFVFAPNGSFSFTPHTSENTTRILFYAVTPDGCVATRLAEYTILHPPTLTVSPATEEENLSEGEPLRFSAVADARFRWQLDNASVGRNASYTYRPDYNAAGTHTVKVTATDSSGLTTNHTWRLVVKDVNRPPIQIARILGITLPVNGTVDANLSTYFLDPDRARLSYAGTVTLPAPATDVPAGNVSIAFDGEFVSIRGHSPGTVFIVFTAIDAGGASVTSDPVPYVVVDHIVSLQNQYCGDKVCLAPENCSSCPSDCGKCSVENESCVPQWDCTAWGACMSEGYRYRNCTVINDCTQNATQQPSEAEPCTPVPTCSDGRKNGNESGVDCGGPCPACPTCRDGVVNQGELGVDCGGPCPACPTCSDGLVNQGESDVDCGGPCEPCDANMSCNRPTDCASLVCVQRVCAAATCRDGVANQGESGVDCGGPCPACPTCRDGVVNQGELGVDCGGPCPACPTCSDGLVNQGEMFADCGGPCRPCVWTDYKPIIIRDVTYALLVFLLLTSIYLLHSILTSRVVFLFRHGKIIHFFYEDGPTYALLRRWNGFARHFRAKRYEDLRAQTEQVYHELKTATYAHGALRSAMIGTLRNLYALLLGLTPNFEFDELVLAARRAPLPFAIRVIILRNTKTLYLMERERYYTDDAYALQEVLKGLDELRKAF